MRFLVGLFVSSLIGCGGSIAAQTTRAEHIKINPAEARIEHDVHVENWRLLDIFSYVLHGTGLRGGYVEMAGCAELPKGRLQIAQGATVQRAMDALVAANAGYRWEWRDGVIDLMPNSGVPLLQTRITHFQKDATNREFQVVIQDLLRVPEVRRRASELGLRQGMSGGGLSAAEVHPVARQPVSIQFNLKNLSLQGALNKIVRASPEGVWLYHESDCDGARTFTVEVLSGN